MKVFVDKPYVAKAHQRDRLYCVRIDNEDFPPFWLEAEFEPVRGTFERLFGRIGRETPMLKATVRYEADGILFDFSDPANDFYLTVRLVVNDRPPENPLPC